VMVASASWGRDVIATAHRLRVVIATPRTELSDFSCNTDLIEIALASRPRSLRFMASELQRRALDTWGCDLPRRRT
jgi:hypothetical protein